MGKFADELAPRFADAEYREPRLSDFKSGTIAWVVQRVIEDVAANPEMKQYGRTKMGRLRLLQQRLIGSKSAAKLTKQDIIEDIKSRRKTVGPATANHDIGCLKTSLVHHIATWEEPDLSDAHKAMGVAKIFLAKNNLTGKANRRTRRPTDEEIAVILADCRAHDARKRSSIRLEDFVLFGLGSARRRGEIVRITHGDVDFENKVYWVRDMKHPTKKKGNDKRFILWPSLEEIIRRQPRLNQNDPTERIFPFMGESVGAAYCAIKKRRGIKDLRLHDNRGDALSRFLLKYPPEDVRLMVSGHDDTKILEKVYDRRDALEVAKAKLPEFRQNVNPT